MNMNRGYFTPDRNNSYSNIPGYRTTKLKYNKKQISVLNVGMLTAGIGFLYLAALGFIFEYFVFLPAFNDSVSSQAYNSMTTLWTIAVVGIIVGTVLSMIWCFRVHKASVVFGLVTIFVYTTAYAIGFGALFTAIQLESSGTDGITLIMSAFAIVGIIFMGTFLITKLMSAKVAMTLRKIIFVSMGIAVVAMLVAFVWSFVGMPASAMRTIFIITSVLSIILSVLFLAYDLWLAQNMSKFYVEDGMNLKMGLFIGFQILVNIIMLLFNLLRLIAVFKN